VWDEQAWTSLGITIGAQVCVLRAPGIYALERLPVQSVLAGASVMCPAEDSFSNHIHADDLAGAAVYAVSCIDEAYVQNPCILNVCDDEPILMGQWSTALSKVFGMPEPECITRAQMQSIVGSMRWSFMRESRRISNAALHAWGYVLKHPSAVGFIEQHQAMIGAQYLGAGCGGEASDV
jgi:nucleoside-diphosphate-sugar epimerase